MMSRRVKGFSQTLQIVSQQLATLKIQFLYEDCECNKKWSKISYGFRDNSLHFLIKQGENGASVLLCNFGNALK